MKSLNKTALRLTVAFAVLLCAGCGKIYDYELQRIAEICGGYEQIKSTWVDASTVRAYCKEGHLVSSKE